MTINLESEIVGTLFDPIAQACVYTIQRGDKRWTVAVPLHHLDVHRGNKANRRKHVATVLENAMRGEPDPLPPEPVPLVELAQVRPW